MDREIWEKVIDFVSIKEYPVLPCPYCNEKSLQVEAESITYKKVTCDKTRERIAENDMKAVKTVTDIAEKNILLGAVLGFGAIATYEGKEPAKFIGFFSCLNCKGYVSATGTAQCSQNFNNPLYEDKSLIKVEYFSPPIPMFHVSKNVPIEVQNEVFQSFNHFHSDLSSSGAKLRRSIEKMCAELNFKEKNLHATISSMEKVFPVEAKHLNSLKLVGNEATHADSVDEEDLLDAFEVQDFVLGLFDRIKAEKEAEEKSNKLARKFDKKYNKQLPLIEG